MNGKKWNRKTWGGIAIEYVVISTIAATISIAAAAFIKTKIDSKIQELDSSWGDSP